MTRLLALPLSAVALLCLATAPAPLPSSETPPAAAAVPPTATVEVSIAGPETASGGFALVGSSGAADAVLRWRIESPDGASDPLRLRDEAGSPVLVFMSPAQGRYRVVLTAQVPADGLDPFGEAVHVVTVGKVPPGPEPTPPGPEPGPDPDLTGIALAVYTAAKGVDDAIVDQAAGAYGSQVSAINAGAYNALELDDAKQQIIDSIAAANPPKRAAPELFAAIDGELQKLEDADKFGTLTEVSAALAEITTGLEAAAK